MLTAVHPLSFSLCFSFSLSLCFAFSLSLFKKKPHDAGPRMRMRIRIRIRMRMKMKGILSSFPAFMCFRGGGIQPTVKSIALLLPLHTRPKRPFLISSASGISVRRSPSADDLYPLSFCTSGDTVSLRWSASVPSSHIAQ
jgi:hypothetical protein